MSAQQLRPMITSNIPLDNNISSDFIKTIHRRCLIYLATSNDNDPIEIGTADKLVSKLDVTDEELKD